MIGVSTALALLVVAFLTTLVATRAFHVLAIRHGIIANPNFRSLHQRPMPRGGCIVFSLVFISAVAGLWLTNAVDANLMRALVFGGTVATLFGFLDDAVHVGPVVKLLTQGLLAGWVLWCFGGNPLFDLPWTPSFIDLAVSWLALVWLMNLYNFMDGVDGMAASGAVFFGATAILVLLLARADETLILVSPCSRSAAWRF